MVRAVVPGEQPGYKLVGVTYTAPYRLSEDDLNQRIPLSIAQWHAHTNLCMPPDTQRSDVLSTDKIRVTRLHYHRVRLRRRRRTVPPPLYGLDGSRLSLRGKPGEDMERGNE